MLLAVVIIATRPGASPSSASVLTAEARAYLDRLTVTEARMSAARNMAGDTVTYLDAQIANQGDRLVRRVELRLEFHDALNQVVLREKAFPVTPRTAPLKPGESRPFQVAFEHMPAEWNRAPPAVTAVNVQF